MISAKFKLCFCLGMSYDPCKNAVRTVLFPSLFILFSIFRLFYVYEEQSCWKKCMLANGLLIPQFQNILAF